MRKIFGLALLFIFPAFVFAQADWKLEKNDEGIQVSTHKPEGSDLKAFRGAGKSSASLEEAVALFEKTETVCEWVYDCAEFRVEKDINADEKIIYFHQKMPWPVADRDVYWHRIKETDPATGAVTFKQVYMKDYPEKEGKVRMASLEGYWRFVPLKEGGIEIIDEQHVNPGGHLPAWLVNKLIVDVPFNSIKKFRTLLEKKK